MSRTLLCVPVLLALLAAPAHAKGPTSFTIAGPGLDEPLRAAALAQRNPTSYWRLVEQLGFFVSAMEPSSPARLAEPPRGTLGPKYRIRWLVPIPGSPLVIRQDLYPYAAAGPVTYMAPGQALFDRETPGGWYRADAPAKAALVARGLPAAPVRADPAGDRERWPAALAAGVGVAGAAAFLALRRRRSQASA